MDKAHDSLVMGSSICVSVQPVAVEIGDEFQEELFSVPFQLPKALYGKVSILGVTVVHQGMVGLGHLQKREMERKVSTVTKGGKEKQVCDLKWCCESV